MLSVVGVPPPGGTSVVLFQPAEPLSVYWYGKGGGDPAGKVVSLPMLRTASLPIAVFAVPSPICAIRTLEFSYTIPSVGRAKFQYMPPRPSAVALPMLTMKLVPP